MRKSKKQSFLGKMEKAMADLDLQDRQTESKDLKKCKYVLCLDIEATCSEEVTFLEDTHEVIELPVILVDIEQGKVIDEFHTFVKPTNAITLTERCTNLTGITQSMVDEAPSFIEAIQLLDQFIEKYKDILKYNPHGHKKDRDFLVVTDGTADIERFLCRRSCRINQIRLPDYLDGDYINLKVFFKDHFRETFNRTLSDILNHLHIEPLGRLHSGLDDARNVARATLRLHELGVPLIPNRNIHMTKRLKYEYGPAKGASHWSTSVV
ncbi:ribonuclease H-like domain-containing protein [Dipodascopsis uninucleata]